MHRQAALEREAQRGRDVAARSRSRARSRTPPATSTGSRPSSARIRSKWWMLISTSSGSAISWRKPLAPQRKSGAAVVERQVAERADLVAPATASRKRRTQGWKRPFCETMKRAARPRRARATMRRLASIVSAIGFSERTCRPASSAGTMTGSCCGRRHDAQQGVGLDRARAPPPASRSSGSAAGRSAPRRRERLRVDVDQRDVARPGRGAARACRARCGRSRRRRPGSAASPQGRRAQLAVGPSPRAARAARRGRRGGRRRSARGSVPYSPHSAADGAWQCGDRIGPRGQASGRQPARRACRRRRRLDRARRRPARAARSRIEASPTPGPRGRPAGRAPSSTTSRSQRAGASSSASRTVQVRACAWRTTLVSASWAMR